MTYDEAVSKYERACKGKACPPWKDQAQLSKGLWYLRDRWGNLLARVNAGSGKVYLKGQRTY